MTDDRSIHERARLLAADALDEELPGGDREWLASHLASCEECRDAAADFATIRAELRALPAPVPPRDLWARTAARLDEVDRSRTRRSALPRFSLSMLGTTAAVSAVVAMVSVSIVSQPVPAPNPGGGFGIAAAPTPTLARTAEVPVASSAAPASGAPIIATTNSNNLVLIDPRTGALLENKVACATSDCTVDRGNSQHIGTVDATNISGATVDTINQKAVVWNDKTIAVVPVKTLAPVSTPTPAPSPTQTAVATATQTSSVNATKTPPSGKTPLPSPSTTPTTSASMSTPVSSPTSSSQPPASPSASITQPQSILSGYAPVGDPAFSPDGVWLAFAARQQGATTGSDVFVWRVGEGTARAVTTSHRATFSGWFGSSNRMLISETLTADQYAGLPQPTPDPDATASPSPTATASPSPTVTANPAASSSPQSSGSATATQIPQGATLLVAASYIVDPATCDAARFVRPILDPVVDPTGQRVVYRTATVYLDAAGKQQFTAADVNYDLLSDMGTVTTPLCPATPQDASPAPTSTSPIPTSTPTAQPTTTPAASPTATATPIRTASATPKATKTPASLATLAPGASPTLPPPATLPQRLPVADPGAVTGDWLARWDPAGTHVAVWVGPTGAPEGQLRLFAVDASDNRLSTTQQLFGALTLRAFQLDESDVIYTASSHVSDGKVHKQAWPDLPPKRDPAPTPIPTQAPADASDRPGH